MKIAVTIVAVLIAVIAVIAVIWYRLTLVCDPPYLSGRVYCNSRFFGDQLTALQMNQHVYDNPVLMLAFVVFSCALICWGLSRS